MKTSLVIPLNHSSSQASSFPRSRVTRGLIACLLIAGAVTGVAKARPSVFLTFSGGSGSEVVVSWSSPITYTLAGTSTVSSVNPYFVFQTVTRADSIFLTAGPVAGAAPTYNSTGAGSGDGTQTINNFFSHYAYNDVNINDIVFRATLDTAPTVLTVGDVITLSAGSLSYAPPATSAGYYGTLPTSGYYNTIIVDSNYLALGSGSPSIPEPSTYACFVGVAALALAAIRRRKTAA